MVRRRNLRFGVVFFTSGGNGDAASRLDTAAAIRAHAFILQSESIRDSLATRLSGQLEISEFQTSTKILVIHGRLASLPAAPTAKWDTYDTSDASYVNIEVDHLRTLNSSIYHRKRSLSNEIFVKGFD